MSVRRAVGLAALVWATLASGCSSKPGSPVEIAHRRDGNLDVLVQIVSVRPSNRATGEAWIAEDRMVMTVKRSNDLLKERRLRREWRYRARARPRAREDSPRARRRRLAASSVDDGASPERPLGR